MESKKRARATTEFRTNRAKLLADNPLCHWCANALATEADHILESDRGGGNELSNLVPACKPCNARRGQAYRVKKERLRDGLVLAPKATTDSGQDLGDIQLIDRLKALPHKEFLTPNGQKPPQASSRISQTSGKWSELALTSADRPRLETMTPDDARSYVGYLSDWALDNMGVTLMPWQLVVCRSITALDDDDNYLRRVNIAGVARQNGKTILAATLIGCQLTTFAKMRGTPQTVINVAHKLDLATALFKYLAPILEKKHGAKISWSYGRQEARLPDGSVWLVRAATPQAGHGYSTDLIVADEGWDISESAIDEGLLPSQRARRNPIMVILSTAGTQDSKALLRWRSQALQQIDAGESGPLGLCEYSPPNSLNPMTPEAWAYANPALGYTLDPAVIVAESKAPNRNAFLRASVNLWVAVNSSWLEAGLWEACATTEPMPPGGILAVETSIDESKYYGVRAVQKDNKTIVTVAFVVDTVAALWAAVDREVAKAPALVLALVPSLEISLPYEHERRRVKVGYRELLKWTLSVRSQIVENRLAHTGELLLTEHVERAVMVKHNGNVALSSVRSPGDISLARAMVWAAALASRPQNLAKPVVAFHAG